MTFICVLSYELSENLEGQTKQMAEDLKEIIDHLNELNRAQDESNPVSFSHNTLI
jgi:nuclear pore complex protein Nup62